MSAGGAAADARAHGAQAASPWVARHASLVPPGARALDLAAGRGRHARLLAARGCRVLAVDRDAAALEALAGVEGVETRVLDLESGPWPLADERFDAIVVTNYLHRPSFDALLATLAPDGVLLYETFAAGHEAFGRPSRRDFLLDEGELLERLRGRLAIVAYEAGRVDPPAGAAVVQRIVAVGPARTRPWSLPPA